MKRRDFLLHAGTLSAAAAAVPAAARASASARAPSASTPSASTLSTGALSTGAPSAGAPSTGMAGQPSASAAAGDDRGYWVSVATRLAEPVLVSLAERQLKARMPVEAAQGVQAARARFSHLEAFGRLLAGLAPWLELPADDSADARVRARYGDLARQALASATDPASTDRLNFTDGSQALVDAAFLAQAILRAPRALWESLDASTRGHVVRALESTRVHTPGFNNWLLFAATVEAALKHAGVWWDRMRVDYAIRQHEQWYQGDGLYSDGPAYHWDYYNAFVIHPMLLDVLDECAAASTAWTRLREPMTKRAQRYAAIQERLIGPDGTYPPIGRSLAYRFGAFQVLAQMALRHALPADVTPPQARAALTRVIRRSVEARGTFDDRGWLRIGFCGHQPGAGETYISTGSLYLCSVGLLPLGLPAADPFWSAPAEPTTADRAWSGAAFPIDKAYSE